MINGSKNENMIKQNINTIMKTKITLLVFLLTVSFVGLHSAGAQANEDALNKLSIMTEYAKAKNYEAAYGPLQELRTSYPKFNRAIYKYGEKILKHKIKTAAGAAKVPFINDLLKLWEERALHFASKTPKGEYAAKACQLQYTNRTILGKTDAQLYACYDAAYTADKKTFTNPKSLLSYFNLMVNLYDAGKQPAKALFDKYDDVAEKIESEVEIASTKLNALVEKEDAGTPLTKKDNQYKKYYGQVLSAYDQVSNALDAKLGKRANCDNLIPLYTKDFDAHKTDAVWLKRAVNRMYYKECTTTPLYEKLVKAYDGAAPSADTKYFVATLLVKNGKSNEAQKYFKQAYDLETDNFKKAKIAAKIGRSLKKRGAYGPARNYFRKALKLNPSNGRPHLSIAAMYAKSANKCGDTNFNKRAVYWLAAQEAQKASRVDPTLKKSAAQSATSYKAKAPTKSEIFTAGNAGQTIKIGCWIGASVTVPKV
jgi:tetratricopeptide (TPR) repeat protein